MDALLRSTFQVLTRGQKTNSYKFALLRAIADRARSTGTDAQEISRAELADRFVHYYWPLTLKYRVRQGTDPSKDPVVMRYLRKLVAEGVITGSDVPTDLQHRDRACYEDLLDTVAKFAFRDVIPRFHTVRRNRVSPVLFRESASGISLSPEAVAFVAAHRDLLRYLAVAGWVRFTQAFSSAPRLFEKISDEQPRRKTAAYRGPVEQASNASCFYCGNSQGPWAIDHVIPWAYVLEDRAWNLVLSCRACNGRKSDSLPTAGFMQTLIDRNFRWAGVADKLPPRIRSDLAEWPTPEACANHLRTMYEQATNEGFSTWEPIDESVRR